MSDWTLAGADTFTAYYSFGFLLVAVGGQKPTPCNEVKIERSPLDVEPPAFNVKTRQVGICNEVMTPYHIANVFRIGGHRDEIIVKTSDGDHKVPVVALFSSGVVPPGDGVAHPVALPVDGGTSHSPSPGGVSGGAPPVGLRFATGYSNAYDFGEALRNAIHNLPPAPPGHIADQLFHYEVVASGAEIGGIAGFDRLFVTIRG